MRDARSEAAIFHIIGAIYDAAIAPHLWMDALEQLRVMFDLSFVASVVRNADRTKVRGIAAGLDHDDYQGFLAKYFRGSPYLTDDKPWYPGQIVRTSELIPPAVFHRCRMYQEYWRPREMHQGVRMAVARDANGIHHSVNLLRPPSGMTFDDADIVLARTLMPHLQRATELGQRLRHADLLTSAALGTLDTMRHAVLLLDQDCRIIHANAAADALLDASDGLGATDGLPHAATTATTARLHAMLACAAGKDGAPPRAGSLRLPRPGGGTPLALLAMPFRHEAHWSLPRRPMVLLCVTDPDDAGSVSGRLMIDLFGLTGSEAALAADLMAGQDLRDIAGTRGRSINTVRTQLAGLMAKTGVGRQSDLMRLMASLPRANDRI